MDTTKLSAKGQIVLPKRVCDAHGWAPGAEFVVENTAVGVLLRPKSQGKKGRIADAAGMLKRPGRKAASLKDMEAAIAAEVRVRHARDRY